MNRFANKLQLKSYLNKFQETKLYIIKSNYDTNETQALIQKVIEIIIKISKLI